MSFETWWAASGQSERFFPSGSKELARTAYAAGWDARGAGEAAAVKCLEERNDIQASLMIECHEKLDRAKVPADPPLPSRLNLLVQERDCYRKRLEFAVSERQTACLDAADAHNRLAAMQEHLNIALWERDQASNRAKDAKSETDACHQLMDECFILMGYKPEGPRPGLVDAVKELRSFMCDCGKRSRGMCSVCDNDD